MLVNRSRMKLLAMTGSAGATVLSWSVVRFLVG